MQTNETGKTLSVLTVLKAVKRRKLYLLIHVKLLTTGAILYALRLSPRFRARALVAVTPVIPQYYLNARPDSTAATANVQDQMRSIRETLYSRPLLESVIREFKLYDLPPNTVTDQSLEDMKSRIEIQVEGADAFYLGFEGKNPQQVMDVTNRLAQLFVQ